VPAVSTGSGCSDPRYDAIEAALRATSNSDDDDDATTTTTTLLEIDDQHLLLYYVMGCGHFLSTMYPSTAAGKAKLCSVLLSWYLE
jgi:hypothetical protein